MMERAEFERLALAHLDAAYTLAFWLLRSRADAEDAVQDAYLRAYRGFRTFQGGDIRPWLLKIVRNVALRKLSDRARAANVISFDAAVSDRLGGERGALQVAADIPSAEDMLVGAGEQAMVRAALAELPRLPRGHRAARDRGALLPGDRRVDRRPPRHGDVAARARPRRVAQDPGSHDEAWRKRCSVTGRARRSAPISIRSSIPRPGARLRRTWPRARPAPRWPRSSSARPAGGGARARARARASCGRGPGAARRGLRRDAPPAASGWRSSACVWGDG